MTAGGIGIFIVLAVILVLCYNAGIRRTSDNVLGGVCGGIARKLNTGANLVRCLAVLLAICTGGTSVLLYILLCIVLPKD